MVAIYSDFFFLRFLGGNFPLLAAYSSTRNSKSIAKRDISRTFVRRDKVLVKAVTLVIMVNNYK